MSYPSRSFHGAGLGAAALLALAACASDGPTAFQSDSAAGAAAAPSPSADTAGRTTTPRLSEAGGAACVSTPSGMIGWWPGDGSAADIVGGQDGTLRNGATFAPGLIRQAFSFDGLNDFMNLGDVLPNGDGTIELWIFHRGGSGFFFAGEPDRTPGASTDGSVLLWQIGGLYGAPFATARLGVWRHVAITWLSSSDLPGGHAAQIFLDGTAAASIFTQFGDLAPLAVGAALGGGFPVNALVDEVTIYDRVLDDLEIAAIAAAGAAGKCRNQPPVAHAGGPYAAPEGTAVTVDGAAASDPDGQALTYTWNFGDGSAEESGPAATHATRTHTYADEGSYTVALMVSDGELSADATARATIANAAPVVQAGADASIPLGGSFALAGSFTDPGISDAPWNYAITWGDQSAASTGSVAARGAIGQSHTFAAAGIYAVTLAVTDADGATGSDALTLNVLYPFSGFFAPVDDVPTVNKVNAGRAVPVKFSLGGDQGIDIFLPGYPKAVSYRCDGGAEDAIEETVTASTSALSYDPVSAQYTYTWKTEKGWANSCRSFLLGLKDGSDRRAEFRFVK